jgi:hypothetical protein
MAMSGPWWLGHQVPLKKPESGSLNQEKRKTKGRARPKQKGINKEKGLRGTGPGRIRGSRRERTEEGLGGVEEFDQFATPGEGGKKGGDGVMVDRVNDESPSLPEGVAVE